MRRLVAGLALVLLPLSVVAAPPAQAAPERSRTCDYLRICGDIRNLGSEKLVVTCNWDNKLDKQVLSYGQRSTCPDTDGYYIPAGRNALRARWFNFYTEWVYYGFVTGWHAISDVHDDDLQLVPW